MQVKLLTSRISVNENGVIVAHEDGAIVELNDDEAQRLIDSGQAERAETNIKAETATQEKKRALRGGK